MTERPEYRIIDILPGHKHFDCLALRATLSTQACADRWNAASRNSVCSSCAIGRLHHQDNNPRAKPRLRKETLNVCLRCGRSDLRVIQSSCICVSCYNREKEWSKGSNAKGKPPAEFEPLHDVEIPIEHDSGKVEQRLLQARHEAEALGRVLMDLPAGARLTAQPPVKSAWNVGSGAFERVCECCGTAGLMMERSKGQRLELHARCCSGEPEGEGWRMAEVRRQPFALDVHSAAAWLNTDSENDGHQAQWTLTAHPCKCGGGQIEARLLSAGGRWSTKCKACGETS